MRLTVAGKQSAEAEAGTCTDEHDNSHYYPLQNTTAGCFFITLLSFIFIGGVISVLDDSIGSQKHAASAEREGACRVAEGDEFNISVGINRDGGIDIVIECSGVRIIGCANTVGIMIPSILPRNQKLFSLF